jgi:hypothetical protein
MTNQEMVNSLTEIKNILSITLKDEQVKELMTNNKSYCTNSIYREEANAEEIALDLLETLNY